MATFFLFGRYSSLAAQKIGSECTKKARHLIEDLGGRVKGIYALLGEFDLVIIAELPDMTDAMAASVGLRKLTDINFFTEAAMPIEQFDKKFGGS